MLSLDDIESRESDEPFSFFDSFVPENEMERIFIETWKKVESGLMSESRKYEDYLEDHDPGSQYNAVNLFQMRLLYCVLTFFQEKNPSLTDHEIHYMRVLRELKYSYNHIAYIVDRSKSTVYEALQG